MKLDQAQTLRRSAQWHIALGCAAAMLLTLTVGGWASSTQLASAVIASGSIVIEGNAKQVQHPTGGVIAELLVAKGQTVSAGDILVRLDATVMRANLAIVSLQINQYLARRARLEAERDNLPDVTTPGELFERVELATVDQIMASEMRLFLYRAETRAGQKKQLEERVSQLNAQIDGRLAQQEAKQAELDLVGSELADVRTLFDGGLVSIVRVNELARSVARLEGEDALLEAQVAEAREKIAEVELQLLQIDHAMRSEVSAELRDIELRSGELLEREIAIRDQLGRLDVVAPVDGLVHQLAVHTVGGVVTPAETLMWIVPQNTELTVEARVPTKDIDQIAIQQDATLRLVAFNRNTTPELSGKVIRISGDAVVDERTGASYYQVGIAIPSTEVERLAGLALVPGMPVECFINTGYRTVLSYFTKPLLDHSVRAFREE